MNDNSLFAILGANFVKLDTYIDSYVNYLQTRASKYSETVNNAIEGTDVNSLIALDDNTFIEAVELSRASADDFDALRIPVKVATTVDGTKQWATDYLSGDQVTTKIGEVVAQGQIMASAVAAAAKSAVGDLSTGIQYFSDSIPRSLVARLPNLTNWRQYCMDVLSDGRASFFDKVSAIINQCTTTESATGGFQNNDSDITGASPMLCFFKSNITDTVVDVISKGLSVVGNMLGGVFGFAANVVTSGISLFRKGVRNLYDTLDIKSLSDGQDPTVSNATLAYEARYTSVQFQGLIQGEFGEAFQALASHPGYYLVIAAVGATHYVGLSNEGKVPNDIFILRYYIKPHLYNFGTGGYQLPGLDSLTSISDAAKWMAQQPGAFSPLEIQPDGDESGYFRALAFSNQLIPLGLAIVDSDRSGQIASWYNDGGLLYRSVDFTNIPWYNRRLPSTVTNENWFKAFSNLGWFEDQSYTDDQKKAFFAEWSLNQLMKSITAIMKDEIFYPYSWVVGQYQSSFSILTDTEVARAFVSSVAAVATVAIVATGAVAALKVKRFLKNKAYQKRAIAERLMYDTNPLPSADELRKANSKAEKWERIAGLGEVSDLSNAGSSNASIVSSDATIKKILIGS